MAIVKKYRAEVLHIINKVDGIYTVELKSLSGSFKYQPGQFLHLTLDEYDPSGQWPESRCFSMQSSPGKEQIRITYAIKGAFTSRMANELKQGSVVTLKLPYGDLFTQEHSMENTAFIAGGTGITPFLSLFSDISFSGYKNPKLYFGIRSEKFNIYQTDLENANKINPDLATLIVIEDTNGKIDIEQIFSVNGIKSTYFISGPPEMISFFRNFIKKKGVPDKQIKTDEWN